LEITDFSRQEHHAAVRTEPTVTVRSVAAMIGAVLCLGLLAGCASSPASLNVAQHSLGPVVFKRANFGLEPASREARIKADWVVNSGDNRGMPFVIIDKTDARVFVFDMDGTLLGAAPALLGLAVGDASVPGIGARKMSLILPKERTTPAGRFVAALGHNARGKEILWVDYNNAISLHPVVKGTPWERRAERLASPTPLDNRISFGCINVPVPFFHDVVHPVFSAGSGVVYVLSEENPTPGTAIR
jgi:hypothetical protein